MKAKITKATKQQWAAIDQIKQRVLYQDQTEDISREEAVSAINTMWKRIGWKSPQVVQVKSPVSACLAWSTIRGKFNSQINSQFNSQINSQLNSQLDSQLYGQLNSQLDFQLYGQLDSQLISQIDYQLYSQLKSQIDYQLYSQLKSQLISQIDSQLKSQLDSQIDSQLSSQLYLSVWWRAWSATYEAAKILGVDFDCQIYEAFVSWCRNCPFVIGSEEIVFCSKNPSEIHWQDDFLHNESGPAVLYRDGFSIYSINGVQLDEQIVMSPETQTVEQIQSDNNADRRAIRIERFGWTRYLKTIQAECIESTKNEVEGTIEAIYRTPHDGTRFIATCPTGRVFVMGVPEETMTCVEARNYLNPFGQDSNILART